MHARRAPSCRRRDRHRCGRRSRLHSDRRARCRATAMTSPVAPLSVDRRRPSPAALLSTHHRRASSQRPHRRPRPACIRSRRRRTRDGRSAPRQRRGPPSRDPTRNDRVGQVGVGRHPTDERTGEPRRSCPFVGVDRVGRVLGQVLCTHAPGFKQWRHRGVIIADQQDSSPRRGLTCDIPITGLIGSAADRSEAAFVEEMDVHDPRPSLQGRACTDRQERRRAGEDLPLPTMRARENLGRLACLSVAAVNAENTGDVGGHPRDDGRRGGGRGRRRP